MNSAILIGNDVNNVSPGYDWAQLLAEVVEFVGAKGKLSVINEQFPLFYEEIWAYATTTRSRSEDDIKHFIAEKVQRIRPNEIHEALIDLGTKEVLTTNYEFTLEQSRSGVAEKLDNKGIVSERRYSLFRHYTCNGSRFWHIHGDATHPASIALGYEHYSGYLQNMRNYIVTGTGESYRKVRLEPLVKRLKRGDIEPNSWLDLIFSHDVHIVGLGLDFVEIHLWWLLTYRARAMNGSKLLPSNNIHYYYPKSREEQDRTKLRFLRANNVNLHPTDDKSGDRRSYYHKVAKRIKSSLSAK